MEQFWPSYLHLRVNFGDGGERIGSYVKKKVMTFWVINKNVYVTPPLQNLSGPTVFDVSFSHGQ